MVESNLVLVFGGVPHFLLALCILNRLPPGDRGLQGGPADAAR
jgi:hypothetical protein